MVFVVGIVLLQLYCCFVVVALGTVVVSCVILLHCGCCCCWQWSSRDTCCMRMCWPYNKQVSVHGEVTDLPTEIGVTMQPDYMIKYEFDPSSGYISTTEEEITIGR